MAGNAGKGMKPQNGVNWNKFRENLDGIDWRKKPNMVIGHIYLYKDNQYKYLGMTDVQGVLFAQMEHHPDKENGGIYLNDDEIKDLKQL